MKAFEKKSYLKTHFFATWTSTRIDVENELSDQQQLICVCGRLATGLHESRCTKFQNKVDSATIKRLAHLLPKGGEA